MPVQTNRAAPMPPDQRREALIAATLPLLLANGIDVTTKQIALACGVAEGTLFRVFPSKDALIDATVDRAFEPGPTVTELAAIELDQPLDARLLAAVTILQQRLVNIFRMLSALRWNRPPPRHNGSAQDRSRADSDIMAALIELIGPDADQFRIEPAAALRYLRLIVFAGSHPYITDGELIPPAEIVSYLLDGVRHHADARADVPAPATDAPTTKPRRGR